MSALFVYVPWLLRNTVRFVCHFISGTQLVIQELLALYCYFIENSVVFTVLYVAYNIKSISPKVTHKVTRKDTAYCVTCTQTVPLGSISLRSCCTTIRVTLIPLSCSVCHTTLYPCKHPWPLIICWVDTLTSSIWPLSFYFVAFYSPFQGA